MTSVRLIMLNPPDYAPDSMKDLDGQFSLELDQGTRMALSRVIDEWTEPGEIKQDTFRQIEIPISNKNRVLLGNIGNPSALNVNNSKIFEIQLLYGDFTYPVQGLQVVEVVDGPDPMFSCVIFGELNAWYRPLTLTYLNDVDLGSDVVDYTWIVNQTNFYQQNENEAPVFPPVVNYGKWFININEPEITAQAMVVYNNYRFWYSPARILKAAFCKIGWQLNAPFLDTGYFDQVWCYLLDPDFETANQLDVANRPFVATRPTDLSFSSLFFNSPTGSESRGVLNMGFLPVSDPGNHYFTRPWGSGFPVEKFYGSFYSGGIIGNFTFEGSVNFTPTNAPTLVFPISANYITLKMSIKKAPRFGFDGQQFLLDNATTLASQTYVDKNPFVNGNVRDYEFNLETEQIKVYQHEVVFIQVELVADLVDTGGNPFNESYLYPDMVVTVGSTFKNNVTLQVIEEGDTLEFGKMLRKDVTVIDLFKGIAHIPNMKVETDTITKVVSLYPEYIIDLYSDGLQEGFFLPNTEDAIEATQIVQPKSLKQGFINIDLGRDVYLKFRDSSDGYILQKNLTDELHSKRIDQGENYDNTENRIENSLFEPLDTGIDSQLSGIRYLESGVPEVYRNATVYIPFMWESQPTEEGEYPEIGYDFAPRIAIAYQTSFHYVAPELSGKDTDTLGLVPYEGGFNSFLNHFGQIFPDGVFSNIFGGIAVGPPDPAFNFYPDLAIVYGNGVNPSIKDFYALVYERSINQAYFLIALSFLVDLDLVQFSNLSFRRKWHIKYKSGAWGEIDFYARLSRVSDFLIGGNITTPVQVIPDNNNFDNC